MHNIYKRTCSVWSLLRAGNKNFHNLLYMPGSEQVSIAPDLAFWAAHSPGTARGEAGSFPAAFSSEHSGCCRCCIPCATCERCTSGQRCICRLPPRTLWGRTIWTCTCPLDLRARSSVAGVWTGKCLELRAGSPLTRNHLPLLVVPLFDLVHSLSLLWGARAVLSIHLLAAALKRQTADARLWCSAFHAAAPLLSSHPMISN